MVILKNSVRLLTLLALLTWIQIAGPVEGYTLKEQEERIKLAERYSVYNNDTIFQGPRSATDPARRWANLMVPYIIDADVPAEGRNRINEAIQEYNTKTCVRWIPRTMEPDYVRFSAALPAMRTGTVCQSFAGRKGGEQLLTLTPGCFQGDASVTIHEMMHALGFFHEQSRPDRDNYVNILTGNIMAGTEHNFVILTNSFTLNTPYDYTSIMQYETNTFSTDSANLDTVTTKTTQAIKPEKVLSDLDVLDICLYYECACPDPPLRSIVCQDDMMTISCPAGQVLSVVGAVFGRIEDTGTTCPSPNALRTNVRNCAQGTTIDTVRASCDDKSQCSLMATTAVFGDPCPNIFKYLSVVYRCNAATVPDVNECLNFNGGCEQLCTNTVGSFLCSCRSGFVLRNRRACADINECSVNNGGCSQRCTNNPGSFSCSCDTGFSLDPDGRTCSATQPPNPCLTNNGGCQQICTNNGGAAQCSCNAGFTLDSNGMTCNVDQPPNPCLIGNGGCQQICMNNGGTALCSCNAGFTSNNNGVTCVANLPPTTAQPATTNLPPASNTPPGINQALNPCLINNGGCQQTCRNNGGVPQCACLAGFSLNPDGRTCNAFIFVNSSLVDQNIFGGFTLNGLSFERCLITCLLTTSCGALSFDNQNACVLHPVNTACGQTFPQAGTTLYRLTTCPATDAAPLTNTGFVFQVIRALFGL